MSKITIDLGHGGKDSGAVGQTLKESDVVLKIGKKLEQKLKSKNINYKFTRLTDKYISLNERVLISNKFSSNYLISIHINSCSDKSVRGVEVYQYDNDNKNLNDFSKNICTDISKYLKIRNRGGKYNKDFVILKNTVMPACLIEIDFISNKEFENLLKSDKVINNLANIIFENMIKHFNLDNTPSNKYYKVCVGSFKDKNNALNCVKDAKKKGFKDAYIL